MAASASGQAENVESDANKRQTLEDLFRPPLDLMFQGSFENVSVNSLLFSYLADKSGCLIFRRRIRECGTTGG